MQRFYGYDFTESFKPAWPLECIVGTVNLSYKYEIPPILGVLSGPSWNLPWSEIKDSPLADRAEFGLARLANSLRIQFPF